MNVVELAGVRRLELVERPALAEVGPAARDGRQRLFSVSHCFPLERADEALRIAADDDDNADKVVILNGQLLARSLCVFHLALS